MVYPPLSLQVIGVVAGLLILGLHALAFLKPAPVAAWLQRFPRSPVMGAVLLTIAAIWSFALIVTMDLGEFTGFKNKILIAIPIAYFLTLRFVDEFLAVRALGMLLLLAAEIPIEAAFLRPEKSRLLLVLLAYVYATLGLFYVGMPYLLRDQIAWVKKTPQRWNANCLAGVACGALLLFCALVFYR